MLEKLAVDVTLVGLHMVSISVARLNQNWNMCTHFSKTRQYQILRFSGFCFLHAVRRAKLTGTYTYLQRFLSNAENVEGKKLRESLRDKGTVIELNFLVKTTIILLLR
jgi:hypothetical protein